VGAVACFSNQDGRNENYCARGFVFAPVLGAIGAVAGAGIGAMLQRRVLADRAARAAVSFARPTELLLLMTAFHEVRRC
jgi:hypothetical protein